MNFLTKILPLLAVAVTANAVAVPRDRKFWSYVSTDLTLTRSLDRRGS